MSNGPYRPCRDAVNNPDDWFIERDGKQYPDDEFLSAEDRLAIRDALTETLDRADPEFEARWAEATAEAEAAAKRDALRRRRHAKDLCYTKCEWRLQCLTLALDGPGGEDVEYGTRGGYYPEELRQIAKLRNERRAR